MAGPTVPSSVKDYVRQALRGATQQRAVKATDIPLQTADTQLPLIGGTWGAQILTVIAQGDDTNQRDGNAIIVKRLQGIIQCAVSSGSSPLLNNRVRFLIFRVQNTEGVTAAIADVLQTVDPCGLHNFQNCQVSKRFTCVFDEEAVLSQSAGGGGCTFTKVYDIACPRMLTTYDNTTAGVSSTVQNHYIAFHAQNAATTGYVVGAWNHRTTFEDVV
jgi:hypothetical protein